MPKCDRWCKDFETSFNRFLTTGTPEDLIGAVVDFRCEGYTLCMFCPLASHFNSFGRNPNESRSSGLWFKRGWCSVLLCLAESSVKTDAWRYIFTLRGGQEGVKRAIGVESLTHSSCLEEKAWRAMVQYRMGSDPRYRLAPYGNAVTLFESIINPGLFLFKFLPIWLKAIEDEDAESVQVRDKNSDSNSPTTSVCAPTR
jgi:hypothetical protein